MKLIARGSSVLRGVRVALVVYAVALGFLLGTRWLPDWMPIARLVENLSYDVRAGLAPYRPATPRVVVLAKPDEVDEPLAMREALGRSITTLREYGARAFGIDFLLLRPDEKLDPALAAALAGEDVVMAWEMRSGSGKADMNLGGKWVVGAARASRTATPVLREACALDGLINLQVDAELGRTIRSVEMWRADPRARPGKLGATASLGFQIYLAVLTRDAADRAGLKAGEPRLEALTRAGRAAGATAANVARVAVETARGLRGARAFAAKTPEMLLAQVEYRLLMARAGVPGALAREAVSEIGMDDLAGFLPVPPQMPRLELSPETGEHSLLIVDFHGRRPAGQPPFAVIPMSEAARPEVLFERMFQDACELGTRGTLELASPGDGSVEGRVLRADGEAVAGVRVLVIGIGGRFGEAVSGTDGRYRVNGLAGGATRFRALKAHGAVVQVGGRGPRVESGKSAAFDIPWPDARGSVTIEPTEAPPAGAELVLVGHRVPFQGGQAFVHARAPASRHVRLDGLPQGTYQASLFAAGQGVGRSVGVPVANGGVWKGKLAVRRLVEASGIFRATVEAGAEVELIDTRDGASHRAVSDGAVSIGGLGEGSYVVLARKGDRCAAMLPRPVSLAGAVVLAGTRLIDDQDFVYPAVDTGRDGLLWGVEFHGYVLDNLLEGCGILDASIVTPAGNMPWLGVVATLGVCLAGSVALAVFTLLPGIITWAAILLGYLWLAWYVLAYRGIWIDVALPTGSLVIVLIRHMYVHYRLERDKAKRRKEIFSRFVNPEMVNRILALNEVVLEGDRSEITVLFSDIRGFTTISEGLDPRRLLDLLNEYFSLMNPILMKHDGTHDKYIGDAIMGFFGAPIPCRDHARQAVRTAVEMLEVNEKMKLEREWFDIGFGINTGEAVTGLLGARNGAVSYSAIGDTVNVASRLEGLNKQFSTKILISESTWKLVQDEFDCVKVGQVKVKGKTQETGVYEVRGRLGASSRDAS